MNILVVGKAKTGTTIVSKSIEKSMPGQPARYYLEPKSIADLDAIANDDAGIRVIKIIYEHWAVQPELRRQLEGSPGQIAFDKVVFIVRDIRDEMISRLMYIIFPLIRRGGVRKQSLKHWVSALKSKEREPQAQSFVGLCRRFNEIFDSDFLTAFLRNEAQELLDYLDVIERSPHDKCVIKYEDFIQENMDALESHLGFPVAQTDQLDGLERTRRSRSHNNWKSVFTDEDVDFFKDALGRQLEQSGYNDWALVPAGRLASEHYSDYVKGLIKKA